MLYVRFPLSLRNVEDLLAERGIDICHETARHWWNRFGPLFAADIKRQRISRMRGFRNWRWQNNRAENSHLPFRRRERAMIRFRQTKSLQKFASVHANVHNHFNSERHLSDRQSYKTARSAALAEWQNLMA
ncbi:MAG: DDE-type integrase/transposase/recombinase [Erythrobacter sp.]